MLSPIVANSLPVCPLASHANGPHHVGAFQKQVPFADEVVLLQTTLKSSKRSHAYASDMELVQKIKPVDQDHTRWHLQKVNLWKYPHALCLDGSAGSFYLQRSSSASASNKWVIHHEGGAWCALDVPVRANGWKQVEHCLERTYNNFGTSAWNAATPDGNKRIKESIETGELASDPKVNPLMHDWNHVHVNYCDGGSFSGRNLTSTVIAAPLTNDAHASKELHFKGNFVLEAIMLTLLEEHDLNKAEEVVLAGCGSGGVATYMHADQWKTALPNKTFVVALVDSGFFLDWSMTTPENETRDFGAQLRSVFQLHNASGSVNEKCAKKKYAIGGALSDCFFPEHGSVFISVPTFARQSLVDSEQLRSELGLGDHEKRLDKQESVNTYRRNIALAMNSSLLSKPQNGAFVSTCEYHCGHWSDLMIDGMHMNHAFSKWYSETLDAWQGKTTNAKSVRFWQEREWSCHDCCPRIASEQDAKLTPQIGEIGESHNDTVEKELMKEARQEALKRAEKSESRGRENSTSGQQQTAGNSRRNSSAEHEQSNQNLTVTSSQNRTTRATKLS